MLKSYVEFLYPGFFFGESTAKEIDSRETGLNALNYIALPENSTGFRFFDKEVINLNGELIEGKPKNYSGWFYKGRMMTIEDVEREKPESTILIGNMKSNHWNRIVWTKSNQAYPLNDEDMVLEA